jgi:hypothetical protein
MIIIFCMHYCTPSSLLIIGMNSSRSSTSDRLGRNEFTQCCRDVFLCQARQVGLDFYASVWMSVVVIFSSLLSRYSLYKAFSCPSCALPPASTYARLAIVLSIHSSPLLLRVPFLVHFLPRFLRYSRLDTLRFQSFSLPLVRIWTVPPIRRCKDHSRYYPNVGPPLLPMDSPGNHDNHDDSPI